MSILVTKGDGMGVERLYVRVTKEEEKIYEAAC